MTFNSYQRTNSAEQRYLYNGNEAQSELDLYDFNARFFDQALGRFLSIDPLTEVIPNVNPYHFSFNNPVLYKDPTGLMGENPWKRSNPEHFHETIGERFWREHQEPGYAENEEKEKEKDKNKKKEVGGNSEPSSEVKNAGNEEGATVYVETDGVGHVYIKVGGHVYSYGRYNGSDSPSAGSLGPTGDGVFLKYSGSDAQDFIKQRTSKYPTVSRTFNVDVDKTQAYFDNLFANGTPNETKGVVIDRYYLIGNNCSTIICGGLKAGGLYFISIQTPLGFANYINYLNGVEVHGPVTNKILRNGPY